MPVISVIVPVYEVESYLCNCVDSILAQTFTDFELILIDDGSPDNCGQICDEYAKKDKRIIVIHKENGGLSSARNAGLDIAQGNYVTFIDSDDVVIDIYLEILYKLLIRYNADVSVGHYAEFCNDFHIDANNELKSQLFGNIQLINNREAVKSIYSAKNRLSVCAWGKLYKRRLFDDLRYPVGRIHEDEAVTPIIIYNSDLVVVTDRIIYGYRVRQGSIMNQNFSVKRYDYIYALELCKYFFINRDYDLYMIISEVKKEMLARYALQSRKNGIYNLVPKMYRMSEFKAFSYFEKILSYNEFLYLLSLHHPRFVVFYEYIHKIKKILGIKIPD